MASSKQFLVANNSTAALFVSWASVVSNFVRTAGWTNTSDTGQLNGAGGNNWAGVSTVPSGASTFYYEIFQSNDGLTTIFLKLEYGNGLNATGPALRATICTGTDGAGNITGAISGPFITSGGAGFGPSTATALWECNFYGTAGSLAIMLWRPLGIEACVAIERSIDASGAYTNNAVTLWVTGSGSISSSVCVQQSLLLSSGTVCPLLSNSSAVGGMSSVRGITNNLSSGASAGTIPADWCAPFIGEWDFPCTVIGSGAGGDFAEGVPFTATRYGTSMTFIPTKSSLGAIRFGPVSATGNLYVLIMRVA